MSLTAGRPGTQQVLAGVMLDRGLALAEQGEVGEGRADLYWARAVIENRGDGVVL